MKKKPTPFTSQARSLGLKGWIPAILIFCFLGIRIFAILYTNPIVTWDDRWFRNSARIKIQNTSSANSARALFFPNSENEGGERTSGYMTWMVFAAKMIPNQDFEKSWHILNLLFLIIETGLIFGLTFWASVDLQFSLSISFLYLSCPLIFGLNRWLMTENHVILALLSFSAVSTWLIQCVKPASAKSIHIHLIPATLITSYVFGFFSTVREYAIPSLFALALGVLVSLVIEKRRYLAGIFLFFLLPFLEALTQSLPPVIKTVISKSQIMVYFHPMTEFIPAVIAFGFGIPLTFWFGLVAWQVYRARNSNDPKKNRFWTIFLTHLTLTIVYIIALDLTKNRTIRNSLPLLITLFCLCLYSIKIYDLPKRREWRVMVRLMPLLLSTALLSSIYDLFFAYQGGANFRHHPFALEHYNHPLFLRRLRNAEDMHVVPAKPYWEYTYPPKVDEDAQ